MNKRKKISEVYPNDYVIIPPEKIAESRERIRKNMTEIIKKLKRK